MRIYKWLFIVLLTPQLLVAAPKGFVATVLEDVDDCVKAVKKVRGVTAVNGLTAIGIITFKGSSNAAGKVVELECISSV